MAFEFCLSDQLLLRYGHLKKTVCTIVEMGRYAIFKSGFQDGRLRLGPCPIPYHSK